MVSESKKEHKCWFIAKSYGYGMVPISWEGWLATLALVLLLLGSAYVNGIFEPEAMTEKDVVRYLLDVALFAGLFLVLFEKKTKGGLKWYWGNRDDV